MPSVSILIPCYNAERWVAAAIQSALDQTHEDKEVIVVDDGSTDGSLDVIKSFGDKIRYETGPNHGGNVARNRLLKLAQGEWLQYLDADDYLLESKVDDQMRFAAETRNTDVVYSPLLIETLHADEKLTYETTTIDTSQSIEEQWIRWKICQTGAALWRSDTLRSIGGWNINYPCCQDNEVTMRAILAGKRFAYLEKAGAIYRIWSDETVCRKNPCKVIETRTQLIDSMLKHLGQQQTLDESHLAAAGSAFFEMSRRLASHDLNIACQYVRSSAAIAPHILEGDAAPRNYRIIYRVLGFRFAEIIARLFR